MSVDVLLSSPVRPAPGARTVCVVADDPLAAGGVLAHVKRLSWPRVLPPERAAGADVVVLVALALTEPLLRRLADLRRRATRGDQSVVLITDVVDPTLVPRAFERGVVRIVPRATATGAVVAAAVRQRWPEPACAAVAPEPGFEYLPPADLPARVALSDREIAIVALLADGLSTAEVATRLAYSERTIKSAVAALLRRLGLRNRSQILAYAYRTGAL